MHLQEVGRKAHYYNTSLAEFTYRLVQKFVYNQGPML
jgi:hypothetical protein